MSVDAWAPQVRTYQKPTRKKPEQSPAAAMRSAVTAPTTATFGTSGASTSFVGDVLSQEYCAPVHAQSPDGKNVPARIFEGPGGGGKRWGHGSRQAGSKAQCVQILNNHTAPRPNSHRACDPNIAHPPPRTRHPEPNASATPREPFIPTNAPVVCVCDHAVAVEHAADVLLRPVPAVVLLLQQVARRPVQRLGVDLVVAALQQCQQRPCSVDDMRVAV